MDAADAIAPLVVAWVAAVGAVVGSFLNVVVARVPAGESVVSPGSRCPACRTPIRWFDNVPVVSWLALRARCRACGVRISPRYPLVEAAGLAFALVAFARHGLGPAALAEFAFAAALLALALIDLDTWLLPNAITWPLLATGLAVNALGAGPAALRPALYGAGLGFAAFALVAWLGERVFEREALGFGDVWLLAGLGAWLGAAALLPVVLLASIQGSVVGLALLALGRGEPGPQLPPPRGPGEAPPPAPVEAATSLAGEAAPPTPAAEAAPDAAAPVAGPESPGVNEAAPAAPGGEEDDWVPPRHAVPFGPFLVAGALEWLWLGDALAQAVPLLRVFR